jgi:thiol reductant ABC exporter CydC subunit
MSATEIGHGEERAPRPLERHNAAAPLGRTLQLARPERGRLVATVVLAAATGACGIALLATSAWLISRAAQRPSVVALGLAVIGVRFFAVARGICRYGERLVGHDTALRALADLRVRIYQRLEVLAPAGLPAFRRGDLLARLVQDVDALQDLILRVIPPYGSAVLVLIPTVALTWYFLPGAGAVLAVSLTLAATAVPWCTRRLAARRESRLAGARGRLSTEVLDLLEGAPDLIAFGAVDAQLARVSAADAELTRIARATSRTAGVGSGLVTLLTGLAVWVILLLGVPAVRSGRLPGVLLAVVALMPLAAFEMVTGLPAAAQSLEGVRQSAARIFEVLDAPPVVTDPPSPVAAVGGGPHRLTIRGLRARYDRTGPWVLDGVDLDLWPGRRLAIVGPSGAGKSTLAWVLLRFLPYESGSVTLDGVELTALAADDVRRVVGLAPQDTHVFDTSIRENLVLARRDAEVATIRRAIRRARLTDWVDELSGGLDTEVGAHGVRMSGGQRQRLGIARSLLADFPILIVDEPGEHLDTATGDALTRDLMAVTRGRAAVLITHRLTGLEAVDEIIVLDHGRVVERGTHDELAAAGGHYARQWERESGGASPNMGPLGPTR